MSNTHSSYYGTLRKNDLMKDSWCRLSFRCQTLVTVLIAMMHHGSVSFLPPANEVYEGYVFTGVCLSTGGGGYPRPTPRGKVEGSGQGGLQAHTWGFSRPTSRRVSMPTPRGVSRPTPRGYHSMHWGRHPPQQMATAVGSMHPTGMDS